MHHFWATAVSNPKHPIGDQEMIEMNCNAKVFTSNEQRYCDGSKIVIQRKLENLASGAIMTSDVAKYHTQEQSKLLIRYNHFVLVSNKLLF